MFVSGIGKTQFGVLAQDIRQLAYEAACKALWDAGIGPADLDAIYLSNFLGGPDASQLHLNSVVAGLLQGFGRPAVRIETACATGGAALFEALRSGHGTVLVLGVEKMTGVDGKSQGRNIGYAGDRELDQREGLIFPASYALIAQQHMLRHGTTPEDLALVAFKNHRNARLNPQAHFHYKDVTMEDIRKSQVVSSPLRLFDCSPITDGAAAVVLSSKRAGDRCVQIAGSALATDSISLVQRRELTTFPAARSAASKALSQAGIGIADIGVMEVHDCFTIAELVAMEDVGLCKPGESKEWVRAGRTQINGDVAVNPDGGLKADGHPIGATGVAQACEIVLQLRGEAGARQVKGAQAGLTHNVGGVGGTAAVHVFKV
ncbi:MAG: thiolase domain-containing protein [Candidatus Micrarchaeota archaeon]